MKTITNSVIPQTATYRRILQSETPLEKPFSQVVAQRQNQRPGEIERPVDMRSKVDGSAARPVKPLERSERQMSQSLSKPQVDRTPADGLVASEVESKPIDREGTKRISDDAKSEEPVAQKDQTIEDDLQEELVKTAKDEIPLQVSGALFLQPEINQMMATTDGNLISGAQVAPISQVNGAESVTSKASEGQASIQVMNLEVLASTNLEGLTNQNSAIVMDESSEAALTTDFKAVLESASKVPAQAQESVVANRQPDSAKTPTLAVEAAVIQTEATDATTVKSLDTQALTKSQLQFSQMMDAYGVTEAKVQVNQQVAVEATVQAKPQEMPVIEETLEEPLKASAEGVSLVTATQEPSKDSGRGGQSRDDSDAKHQINAGKLTNTSSPEQADRFQGLLQVDKNESVMSIKETVRTPIAPAAILDQIKEAMVKQPLKIGEHSEMIIKLKPEELGKVELKIEVHKDSVIAKFEVASQMVKETIESNLSDLRNSLKDKGFGDMSFDVNVAKEKNQGQQHSSGNSKRGRQSQRGIAQLDKLETQYQKSLASLIGNSQFEHYA